MQTLKLPIPPEGQSYEPFVRGDSFPTFSFTVQGGTVTRAKCQIKSDTASKAVLEWDTDNESATISEDGATVTFLQIDDTSDIRGGRYYGDIEVTFAGGVKKTILSLSLDVKEDYTK